MCECYSSEDESDEDCTCNLDATKVESGAPKCLLMENVSAPEQRDELSEIMLVLKEYFFVFLFALLFFLTFLV